MSRELLQYALLPGPISLESGDVLSSVTVAYETYGAPNATRSNVVLVCHALTGDAHTFGPDHAPGWWQGLIGPGKSLDTREYYVVCSNFLGGCYGTTGPTSINPETGVRYGMSFPQITVRDMVRVQAGLLELLGVTRLICVIGGSLGGMQALEWAMMYPELVARVIPIGCGLSHSAWAIGLNEAARRAIIDDADWNGGEYTVQPARGLGLARMIAMISYRSPRSFQDKFGRALRPGVLPPLFEIESYLRHQAEKLVNRFDANTYLYITRAMDSHDVSRGRGPAYDAVRKNPVHCLAIGVRSDTLYPTNEQREIASTFPHGEYAEIDSPHGHDAFLIEYDQLNTTVRSFLQRTSIQDSP